MPLKHGDADPSSQRFTDLEPELYRTRLESSVLMELKNSVSKDLHTASALKEFRSYCQYVAQYYYQ